MEKQMTKQVVEAQLFRRSLTAAGIAMSICISFAAKAQTTRENPAGSNPEPAAAATPASAPGAAEAERVVVTGSNIPTAEEVTAAPVDTLNTQEINRTGSQEILTVLQKRNPSFTGAGNLGNTNANIASSATLGGTVVSIRGFATLVLYEGRRIADSAAISSGGAQFTDAALFPAALISRIEVLKDGASAIYGSEAVGGVVNIFTKDDFQGAELGFRYGTALDAAVAERRGYALGGVGNETTQITIGMQYYEIDPLFERQRDYSAFEFTGTNNYAGSVFDQAGQGYNIIGETPRAAVFPGPVIANSPFDVGVVPGSISPAAGFAAIPQFYTPVTPKQQAALNLGTRPTSTLDTARTNIIASADHQIFGKQLEIFGNFLYYRADYQSFLNAQPLNNFSTDASGTFLTIPAGRVGVPFGSPGYMPGVNNTIFNPFNQPFNILDPNDAGLFVGQRYNQTSPRVFDNQNNLYRFLGGIRSQITPDWTAEAAAYYSKYDISYENSNLVRLDQLNKMIAGTAVDNNGAPIPALDFFAVNPIGTGPGQVTSAQFSTLFGTNIRESSSFQRVFDAKLTGFPFELPGGKLGVAVGAEYRQEGFRFQDSPEIFVASVPQPSIDVKRDIYSFYGELDVPIVGSSMKVPGIYNLELTLAGRYDHYEGVSEDAKVPKVAFRYQPIKDLTLRATYSDSFVAPNLFQLNGPAGQGASPTVSIDGGPPGQASVETPTNPNLIPSTAESYSAGFVYSPSFLPGLTITADYFRTLQQGIVAGRGAFLILTSVDQLGTASPFANLVAFNNFPGLPGSTPVTGPGQIKNNLNQTFYVDQLQNLAAAHEEGVDMSLHYTMDLKTFGQFELGVNAIVYTEAELKTAPQSHYYNILGTDGAELVGATPDYKLTFLSEYRWNGFSASLLANYIPKMYNAVAGSLELQDFRTFQQIQDYITFDGRLQYTFVRNEVPGATATAPEPKDSKGMRDGKNLAPAPVPGSTMNIFDRMLNGTTVAVGCNNIFDRTPPFVESGNSNTDLSVYDGIGRFLYFEISKKF
jgi:iron complex outermembrane recepter protein